MDGEWRTFEEYWDWVLAEYERTTPFDEVDRMYVEYETCGGE